MAFLSGSAAGARVLTIRRSKSDGETSKGLHRWICVALVLVLAVCTAGLSAASPAAASGTAVSSTPSSISEGQQQILFEAGTGGYGCYRIPALVGTKDGSLLAFAEGRKAPSCGDRGDFDLVMRRSTNDGRTWSPIRVVPSGDTAPGAYGAGPVPAGIQAGSPVGRTNPAAVADLKYGTIYLLSTSNPVNNSYPRIPWVQESRDDGLTWSRPTRLGVTLTSGAIGSNWFATGPGHGIQLTGGAHPGRLVVGAHQKTQSGDYAGYLYMDPHADGSGDWHGAHAVDSMATAGPTMPAEVSVAEVSGGSVYAVARNEGLTKRVTATIPTPADSSIPSVPVFTDTKLPSPGDIQGSVMTLHPASRTTTEQILLSAPAGVDANLKPTRTNMTIWSRCGTTWNAGKLISGGRASYSDLALLPSNEIGLLYEGGATFSAGEIRFTRFSEAQLGAGCNTPTASTSMQDTPAPGATTPDATPQANDGYLKGDATLSAGRLSGASDRALNLDGTGDYADVPYGRSLRPGTGDFTFSMWFKYTAKSADPKRVLFWAYGINSLKPQVWLKTLPASDSLYAWVQGSGGGAWVTLTDDGPGVAFGDGNWHFVSLVRSAGHINLKVAGAANVAGKDGVIGDVTDSPAKGVLGIRIGAKHDTAASEPFLGAIDEFRLFRTALTGEQLDSLAIPSSSGGSVDGFADGAADHSLDDAANDAQVLRLPFQVVDQPTPVTRTTIQGVDDESGNCTDGKLLGTRVSASAGKFGGALSVNSTAPGVYSPLTPALDVGARDFTYSMWFNYSSATDTSARALLWAYGVGPTEPQIWVQALPSSPDTPLLALIQTDAGAAQLKIPDRNGRAFGDGNWHHVTLVRQGGQVTFTVDGQTASATSLAGSLTTGKATGIDGVRLGSKPDGTKVLGGLIDEFRLYDHALSASEFAALSGNALLGSTAGLLARWSFEDKFTYSASAGRAASDDTPATPDHSAGRCHNAYLLNGATLAPGGRDGTALRLDGQDDAALVQYSSGIALAPEAVRKPTDAPRAGESTDFTVSVWFTYVATSTSPDQVLFWGYGAGSAERQVWLRASPAAGGVYADVQTDTANVTLLAGDTVSGRTAFGDGDWHQVTLVRSGESLTLYVDAVQKGTATLGDGALIATDTFTVDGFRLGSKPDGTQPLKGSLDEVRVFQRALTATDVGSLQSGTVPAGASPALWLPFDVITSKSYGRM